MAAVPRMTCVRCPGDLQVKVGRAAVAEPGPGEMRARISPYYMVVDGEARLSGVLVTVVPAANKVIHGTSESVMMPAMVSDEAEI